MARLFQDGNCLIDNLFSRLREHVGMKTRGNRIGFYMRSGTSVHELVCLVRLKETLLIKVGCAPNGQPGLK